MEGSVIIAYIRTAKNQTIVIVKKLFFLPIILACFFTSADLSAQTVSLQAFTGYQFFGSAYTYDGQLVIQPSNVLGGGLEFGLNRRIGFNAIYLYQNTDVNLRRSGMFYDEHLLELDVHYVMLGSTYHHETTSKLTPFGGLMFGLSIMEPKEAYRNSEIFFAVGAQGGVRLSLNEVLGINFRGQFLAPLSGFGAALWCGTGGCDVGLSSTSTIVQMNVMAGLDIKLN